MQHSYLIWMYVFTTKGTLHYESRLVRTCTMNAIEKKEGIFFTKFLAFCVRSRTKKYTELMRPKSEEPRSSTR